MGLHERILDMWAEGIPAPDIAALIGRSTEGVRSIVKRKRDQGDARATRRGSAGSTTWTPERTEELKRLWNVEKWSASVIAKHFGDGVTRNMVIGKVNRMNFAPRVVTKRKPRPSRARRRPYDRRARLMKMPRRETRFKSVPIPDEPVSLSLTFMDLPKDACKWPHGDGPFTFCGHRQTDGSSYCEFHERASRYG